MVYELWILIKFLRSNEVMGLKGCREQFSAYSHMSFVGGVTLLDLDLFWGVQSGTRHWAT